MYVISARSSPLSLFISCLLCLLIAHGHCCTGNTAYDSTPMPPQASPFWLCHACGAQTRPLMVDGVPHCASCNSEFIEILDEEINPDPRHELPPAPPTRPGQQTGPPPIPQRPNSGGPPGPGSNDIDLGAPHRADGGFLGGLFNSIFGGEQTPNRPPTHPMPEPPRASGQERPQGRSWEWNFGGGSFRIQGYTGPVGGEGSPWVGGYDGAPGDANQGLDAFFRGFGAPPPQRRNGRPVEALEGVELLQALMGIIMEEGNGTRLPFAQNGQLGDYVMTENGFNDVLERLMQATGPQGPLPAPDSVIDALKRFTFDEKMIESSQYKDCPVCMSDFVVGDEAIKITCGHIFHPDCLVPWLKTNGSCPVCRTSLVPEAEDPDEAAPTEPQASSSTQPAPPATGTGAPGIVMGVLNRLFGQAGSAESSTNPPPAEGPHDYSMPAHPLSPSPVPSNIEPGDMDPPDLPAGVTAPPIRRGQSDFDRELYRAAKNRGEVVELPWSAGHEHVTAPFALLGIGETEDPLLFCHAKEKETVGDFGMLQMRRLAGRGGVENGVCCHSIEPGLTADIQSQCGRVMRTCPDMPSGEHDLD